MNLATFVAPLQRTISAGISLTTLRANRAGWEAHGLELSAEAAAYARDTLGLDVRQTAAEEMPFAPGAMDVSSIMLMA